MKIISHRGNLNGPDPYVENKPQQIEKVLKLGYDVEIDLWVKDKNFYLGHDNPCYKVDKLWLITRKENLWVHLKNLEAAETEIVKSLNYFWHENDKFTLTSKGIPWCYPGIYIDCGITVVLEDKIITENVYGVCTDYPEKYKGIYDEKCIN